MGGKIVVLATERIEKIKEKVRKHLVAAERDGIYLTLDGHKQDDEWLYIVVLPNRPGVRASDHARTMAQIERDLRAQGDDKVLLVPALEE